MSAHSELAMAAGTILSKLPLIAVSKPVAISTRVDLARVSVRCATILRVRRAFNSALLKRSGSFGHPGDCLTGSCSDRRIHSTSATMSETLSEQKQVSFLCKPVLSFSLNCAFIQFGAARIAVLSGSC